MFERVFWPDDLPSYTLSPMRSSGLERGELVSWHNLNHASLLPGSRTLLAIMMGAAARLYEARRSGCARARRAEAVASLRRWWHRAWYAYR